MALAKCPRCDIMFNKLNSAVCPKCLPEEEEEYDKIRDIISGNEEWTAEALAETAGVQHSVVLRMLEQGIIANISIESIRCGRCGAPAISASKKLCQECLGDLDKQMAAAARSIKSALAAGSKGAESVRSALDSKRR